MFDSIGMRALEVVSDHVFVMAWLALASIVGGLVITQFRKLYTQFRNEEGEIVSEPVLFEDRNRIRTFAGLVCALQYSVWLAIALDADRLVVSLLIATTAPLVGAACPLSYRYLLIRHVFPLVADFFRWLRGKFKKEGRH